MCLQAAPCVLAVGHACRDVRQQGVGHITLWTLKDPLRPLRVISTPAGVTSIAWSKRTPIHVAVGLRSGIMAVYDARLAQAATLAACARVSCALPCTPLLCSDYLRCGQSPCSARCLTSRAHV